MLTCRDPLPGADGGTVKENTPQTARERADRPETELSAPVSRRLKVLAVYGWREFWSMGEGSGAPSFFLSITSFPRRGHEMHVLMPGAPDAPLTEDYHGVTLHRFPTTVDYMPESDSSRLVRHFRRLVTYAQWFRRALPEGRSLAERLSADVVFGMGELGAPVAYRIAKERGIPNVTRLFGIGMSPDGGLVNALKRALRYRETRALATPADYVILCDDGSRGDVLARRLGVDASRLLFWPNGVDKARHMSSEPSVDVREQLGIPGTHRVLLSVSRLHPEKHIERIIEAFSEVAASRGDATLVIVGSGTERESLERLASAHGVAGRVVFAGSVDRELLPDFYKMADVFVALSDRTNVSNSLHEAMMSGLPAVVLDTGETASVVTDGDNGVLVGVGELKRVPAEIASLLEDDDRRLAMGARAQRSADERLPTLEERQSMEAGAVERAVREREARRSGAL